jgi:hypothetical protein
MLLLYLLLYQAENELDSLIIIIIIIIKYRDEVVEQRNGKWFGHQIHLPQNSSLEQTQQSPIPHHSITNASIIFPPSSQRICTVREHVCA